MQREHPKRANFMNSGLEIISPLKTRNSAAFILLGRIRYTIVVVMQAHKCLILFLALALLLSSAPQHVARVQHGSARTLLQANEYEVIWFSSETASNQIHTISWSDESSPVTVWVVNQELYNATAGGEPEYYMEERSGKMAEIVLDGPLPMLFYVITSPTDQWIYIESWSETPWEKGTRVYFPPITMVSMVVVVIVALYLYFRHRRT